MFGEGAAPRWRRCHDTTEVTSKSARKSFNPRFRDDFLATEQLNTLLEAQVLTED